MRKRKTFKKLVSIGLIAVCTIGVLAGCGNAGDSTSKEKKMKLVMTATPDAQQAAGLTIAVKNGYFADEGLDVTLTYSNTLPDIANMVAGGGCDFAYASNYNVYTWQEQGTDWTIVAISDDMGGTQAAAIRDDIKLTCPQDLEGLKLGLVPGGEVGVAFMRMCEMYDVDWDKIIKVPLQPADQLSAFENGEIDIIACYEPWIVNAEEMGGRFLLSGTKCDIPGIPEDVDFMHIYSNISCSQEMLEEHPDIVEKVIRASERADEFINENREEAVKLLSEPFDIEEEKLAKIMDRNVYEFGVPENYKENTLWLQDYLMQAGELSKKKDFDEFHDFSILKEIMPEKYYLSE